jgi:hypothetical protein
MDVISKNCVRKYLNYVYMYIALDIDMYVYNIFPYVLFWVVLVVYGTKK